MVAAVDAVAAAAVADSTQEAGMETDMAAATQTAQAAGNAHAREAVGAEAAVVAAVPRVALLAGATGLVGRALLALLLADPAYAAVHCIGRRASGARHAKLTSHIVDFDNLSALPVCDDVFIALGTTIKVAGSQAAFKKIDLDAYLAIVSATRSSYAIKNKAFNGQCLGVVSAMGADAQSSVFYNRIKGQMEEAVSQAGFASVSIARPSMLAGDRASLAQAPRVGEQIGLKAMQALSFLIPADYKAIEATQVARALLHAVKSGKPGSTAYSSGQLRNM